MRLDREQLDHVLFLSETIMENRKRALMPEAMQCLIYIVKTLEHADVPDETMREMLQIMHRIEQELIAENERLKEIRGNLSGTTRSRL